MYKAGSDENIQFLVGQTLELVCFAMYHFVLHFSQECRIDVECDLIFETEGVGDKSLEPGTVDRAAVLAALERRVKSATFLKNSELLLNFDDGSWLTLFPDANYESYRIQGNGKSILI